jgi:hypothetical protein
LHHLTRSAKGRRSVSGHEEAAAQQTDQSHRVAVAGHDTLLELKREHAETTMPARQAAAEVLRLERRLSDLVNQAYGLTPEEVALMWATAPPRMPLTP